ncbi:hypothetical protein F4803DRAFT_527750 [Xylaria telfairii]|nr:hypothetical protein F4803DRAFT_527750 [Xylaria telfairii]
MGFEMGRSPMRLTQFIILLIFTPLGTAVTAVRLVAIRRTSRKPGFEDWMAVLATLFFALTNLTSLIAISYLNGRTIEEEVRDTPWDYASMRKSDFASLYFYFVHSITIKFSTLGLFYRIFGVNRTYRKWIYAIGLAQAILTLSFIILHPLTCRPFNRYFDLTIPGSCRSDGSTILAGETPNSLIDIAMVVLAMIMIRPLVLPSRVKWSLRVLFGMGAIVGIIGFIKIGITYSGDMIYSFGLVSIWTCIQMFISILCCCLPIIYHSFPTINFKDILQAVPSHASFGRLRPKKSSNFNSTGQNTRGWDSLEEYDSTHVPAWPRVNNSSPSD